METFRLNSVNNTLDGLTPLTYVIKSDLDKHIVFTDGVFEVDRNDPRYDFLLTHSMVYLDTEHVADKRKRLDE